MKKFFYMAVAAIAALSSCSQDEVLESPVSEAKDGSFIATFEQSGTRTTLGEDGSTVYWKAGDEVNINGKIYTAASAGTSTVLNPNSDAAVFGDAYRAFYPASYVNADNTVSLPEVQTYNAANSLSNVPMVAYTEIDTKNLEFKNICAVLAVTVPKSQVEKVRSITVSADQFLSGDLNLVNAYSGHTAYIPDVAGKTKHVTLDCGDGVETSETGTTFYIALPVTTLTSLKITVCDGIYNYIMDSKGDASVSLARNTIYPVTFKTKTKETDCFRLTALEDDSKVYFAKFNEDVHLQYSTDNGETWKKTDEYPLNESTAITLSKGQFVWFKGENRTLHPSQIPTTFGMSGKIEASGNIMSLLGGDSPATVLSKSENRFAFFALFRFCTALERAGNLYLPSMVLTKNCYDSMFYGCTNLKTAPALPAMDLDVYCYDGMFAKCSSLKTAPELPATELAKGCYWSMFENCFSLETAPEELPATELIESCYNRMFYNCTSLETVPKLSAAELAKNCYCQMFEFCSSLQSVTMLATDTSAEDCLTRWLSNAGTDHSILYVASGMEDDPTIIENKGKFNIVKK